VIAFSGTATGDTHAVVWQRGDTTPPAIVSHVTGTLGQNGWYTSNVTVTWTVTDAETAITTPACASSTVSADTAGTTLTCSATSTGGTATQSVTIARDATPPVVAFAAHPASYSANVSVAIPCTASDPISGLATACQGVNAAGSTLPLGLNKRTATATDKAGNTATVTTSFTITAAAPSVITPAATATVVPAAAKARALVATRLSPRLKAGRKAVLVTLRAPAGAIASGTIQLRAKVAAGKAKLRIVGSAPFKLTAGQTRTFTIALSKSARTALARSGRLTVRVAIVARDAAGTPRTTTRSITLKLARK
jgi:hypothetical protein